MIHFAGQLISAVPALLSVRDRHLEEYDELLPHVFMGDVTRFAVANAGTGNSGGSLPALLAVLEKGLNSDNHAVAELIGVSFVENLCGETAAIEWMLPRMGKLLRLEVKRICGV